MMIMSWRILVEDSPQNYFRIVMTAFLIIHTIEVQQVNENQADFCEE